MMLDFNWFGFVHQKSLNGDLIKLIWLLFCEWNCFILKCPSQESTATKPWGSCY